MHTKVLVTGGSGFLGRTLVPSLVRFASVSVLARRKDEVDFGAGIPFFICDLAGSAKKVKEAVRLARPEIIIHLAAATPANSRHGSDYSLVEANGRAADLLFSACLGLSPTPRVLVASSSSVYGPCRKSEVLTERRRFSPMNHYGISKALVEVLAVRAALSGLSVIRCRLFNVIGPGQEKNFVVPVIARQIALIEAGLAPAEIEIGNLESSRDFVDVRDAAAALILLSKEGKEGEVYNVCSSRPTKIRKVLEILLSLSGLDGKVIIRERPGPPDLIPHQRGSSERMCKLGWRPSKSLRTTLRDVLEDWRERVRDE